MTTVLLAAAACALLFLAIWLATVTLPFKRLAANFPPDVQERLKPRLAAQKLDAKRVLGGIGVALLLLAWLGVFVLGGLDGVRRGFGFGALFLRFFTMGAIVKIFDVVCLDYILLTRTQFFQHYLPETAGCAGWKQFGFNRRQQLRQCVLLPVWCLLGAAVFALR